MNDMTTKLCQPWSVTAAKWLNPALHLSCYVNYGMK